MTKFPTVGTGYGEASVPANRGGQKMIDATPIIDAINRRGGIAVVLGYDDNLSTGGRSLEGAASLAHDPDLRRLSRQWYRMVQRGTVSIDGADKWCIRVLGLNPALVYGPLWWEDVA